MKARIKKVSEITGLSPSTVSNALNNKRRVSRETVKKVLAASQELGYTARATVKGIKLVIYKREGQVLRDTPFFQQMIDGISTGCRDLGYGNSILYLERFADGFDAQLNTILNDPLNAILLLGVEMHEEDTIPFKKAAAPVMLLDTWFVGAGLHTVVMNNTDSVYTAVRYMIDKGHRNIGYLKGKLRIQNFFYREIGWTYALFCAGLPVQKKHVVPLATTMQGAYADMLSYLDGKPELASAYFADNDTIAVGVMKALYERGIKVPDEVSIIGFDDIPYADISTPPLTTIRVRKREMGQVAVRQLIHLIQNPEETPLKIEVNNDFIERGSVKDLNA
jgi:LacI family transcriptional regulator